MKKTNQDPKPNVSSRKEIFTNSHYRWWDLIFFLRKYVTEEVALDYGTGYYSTPFNQMKKDGTYKTKS